MGERHQEGRDQDDGGQIYDVVIEWDRGGYYVASISRLPSFRVEAESSVGLKALIQRAIPIHLEQFGEPIDGVELSMVIEEVLSNGNLP